MTTTNSLNINQSGVVTFDASVGSFSNSVIDEYSVLCGAANNQIYSLGTGQAGQILTSQGPNAYPTWSSNQTNSITTANILSVTIPGTYTYIPSSTMQYVIVECVGGGGGAPGSGAGYAKSTLSASQVGASQTVTVGAGGLPNQNGNASSFGSLVIAEGGLYNSDTASPVQGGGGTGQIVIVGQSSLPQGNPAASYLSWGNPAQYGSGGYSQTPGNLAAGNGAVIITEFS